MLADAKADQAEHTTRKVMISQSNPKARDLKSTNGSPISYCHTVRHAKNIANFFARLVQEIRCEKACRLLLGQCTFSSTRHVSPNHSLQELVWRTVGPETHSSEISYTIRETNDK
jgi:hypothetical protein